METFDYLVEICLCLIPVILAVLLIVMIVALVKGCKLMNKINKIVDNANPTIEICKSSVEKIQEPLNLIVKNTKMIDKAEEETIIFAKAKVNKVINILKKIKNEVNKN